MQIPSSAKDTLKVAQEDRSTRPTVFRRKTNVLLWTAQAVLAALFVFAGAMKLVVPIDEMARQTSLPTPFLHFIGVAELLGGLGLIFPAMLRIRPILTPLSAAGLFIIMLGAIWISAPAGAAVLFPIGTAALLAFVAYGRFRSLGFQKVKPSR